MLLAADLGYGNVKLFGAAGALVMASHVATNGREHVHAAVGTGPIDATFRAIDEIIQKPNTLLEYNVHAITEGIDAQGEVSVRLLSEGNGSRVVGGYGADTDIIVASAKAFLGALNRLLVEQTGKGREAVRQSV